MSVTPSKRERIILALVERLGRIQVANGFSTDAGMKILTGETPVFGPDDPPAALAIVPGPAIPGHQMMKVVTNWTIEIQAMAAVDQAGPLLVVERVLSDIQQVLELEDRSLGGLLLKGREMMRGESRILEREDGSAFVGVGATYIVMFEEPWGAA